MATYDLAYPGAAIDAILNTAYFLQEAGYIFRGSASEYSGTPSKRVWLIAPAGFTGYGISSPVPQGSIGICLYNGTSWVGKIINVATIDSTPTQNSGNAVSSGGAYAAINQLSASVTEALENLTFTDTTPSAFQDEYINMKVSTTEGGVERILTFLTILAATTSKAGLMSAEDKAKVDSFLANLRSLTFDDTTASTDQGTKITETLKATIGGVQEVIDSITLLAATSSKAGLLSASDKAYIDALPATLTNLSNSISGALALMESLVGYYTCDTAAGTAAKTVAATGYSLTNGGCIRIKMTNANTAANVTLNINSTGAKAMYYDGTQASSTNTWEAGEVLEVYYDGTQYQCASGGGGLSVSDFVHGVGVDLEFADRNGNVIASFSDGNFRTKKFDSVKTPSLGDSNNPLEIKDENNNSIVAFQNGHIRTRNFYSGDIVATGHGDAPLDIADDNGYVIVRFSGGNLKTKYFDSSYFVNVLKPNLYKKKMCAIGDSYIANHQQSYTLTWHYLIAQENSMAYVNYGINGNGLIGNATGTPVVDRYTEMDNDADYVIVAGGKNDYNVQISIADFKTGLATLCAGLVNKYAARGTKISFFTPWDDYDQGTDPKAIRLIEYVDAIKEICGKYSIPVFDSSRDSSMFMYDATFRATYCQASNDISHLNANGHLLFKNRAFHFLNSL